MSQAELIHLFFFTLYTWTAGWLPRVSLAFLTFFLFSPLPLNLFDYSQCTKGCAPLRFFLILLTFQKKKKYVRSKCHLCVNVQMYAIKFIYIDSRLRYYIDYYIIKKDIT